MKTATKRPVDVGALTEVLAALRMRPKHLPSKYFYDARGAELFEEICALEEYYPTRTELHILRRHGAEMAAWIGDDARLVEYGSGSGEKTRLLLRMLGTATEYVPIDISQEQLFEFAASLRREFPQLRVNPLHADYTRLHSLPKPVGAGRTVLFFPGSTIGNLHPLEAREFLRNAALQCGSHGGLLIGVDLKKDRGLLERAYNDARGVTAEFNRNILSHINDICDADFDVSAFEHHAFYDVARGRIEMHLISAHDQLITLARSTERPEHIRLKAAEVIVTEYSYKYSVIEFQQLARSAGYRPAGLWQDDRQLFSVMAFDIL